MDKWLAHRRASLRDAVSEICLSYDGPKREHVRDLVELNKPFLAYHDISRIGRDVPQVSKKALFIDTVNVMLRQHSSGAKKRSAEENGDDENLTDRTKGLMSELSCNMQWWSPDFDETMLSLAMRQALENTSDGLVDVRSAFSTDQRLCGTYMHEKYGEGLTAKAATALYGFDEGELEAFIPGRLIHPEVLHHGITPDGMACYCKESFRNSIDGIVTGKKPGGVVASGGNSPPQVVLELKTSQKANVTRDDVSRLHLSFSKSGQERTKACVESFLASKFADAGWMKKTAVNADKETIPARLIRDKILLGKVTSRGENHRCSMFLQSTNFYPTKVYRSVGDKVKKVKAVLFPLFSASLLNKPPPPPPSSRPPNRGQKRRYFGEEIVENESDEDDNKEIWTETITLSDVVKPGRAACFLLDPDTENDVLCSWQWEESPFVMGPNSKFYGQVMAQNLVARCYGNSHVKATIAVMFKDLGHRNTHAATAVFMMDVPIASTVSDRMLQTSVSEVAYAMKGLGYENEYDMMTRQQFRDLIVVTP